MTYIHICSPQTNPKKKKTVRLWDARQKNRCFQTLSGHKASVYSVSFRKASFDLLATASQVCVYTHTHIHTHTHTTHTTLGVFRFTRYCVPGVCVCTHTHTQHWVPFDLLATASQVYVYTHAHTHTNTPHTFLSNRTVLWQFGIHETGSVPRSCMCVCVCARARACVRACVLACVRVLTARVCRCWRTTVGRLWGWHGILTVPCLLPGRLT